MIWCSSQFYTSRLNELKHCTRAERARGMYGQLSMPTAESEDAAAFPAEFFGCALDGIDV